jgi:hypothetical protein
MSKPKSPICIYVCVYIYIYIIYIYISTANFRMPPGGLRVRDIISYPFTNKQNWLHGTEKLSRSWVSVAYWRPECLAFECWSDRSLPQRHSSAWSAKCAEKCAEKC